MTNIKRVKRGTHKLPLDMGAMARHIKPVATWEHLDFTGSTVVELKNVCSGFKSGKSQISVLAGGSSAGKMLAAEAIAAQLGKDLMRIDLSAVASKYIGETEKNLNRLFDSARNGDVILFFDEADALFGKRSEVKDSHDRYANIEVNYLLKCVESHPGLTFIAVDDMRSIDVEFKRRFRHVIDLSGPNSKTLR